MISHLENAPGARTNTEPATLADLLQNFYFSPGRHTIPPLKITKHTNSELVLQIKLENWQIHLASYMTDLKRKLEPLFKMKPEHILYIIRQVKFKRYRNFLHN